jgi:CBS domain-containing protein
MQTVDDILESKGCVVWSVHPDETVYAALLLMAEKNVGALPVLENEQLVGMLSERDYARKVLLEHLDPETTLIREIMAPQTVYAHLDQTLDECMRVMTYGRFRHLPVLHEGKVVGIVSIGDIVKSLIG